MIAVFATIGLLIIFMLVLHSRRMPTEAKLYAWFMLLLMQIAIAGSVLCR